MKSPRQVVGRYFPAFGHGRHGLAGPGIVLAQPLDQGHHDVKRLLAVQNGRIEVVRLRQIAQLQGLGAVAFGNGAFAFGAAGQAEQENDRG